MIILSEFLAGALSDYLSWRHSAITKALKSIPKIVVPSQYLQGFIRQECGLETQVIEHGIEKFVPVARSRTSNLQFGYFGAAIAQKGFEVVLRGFELARKAVPEIELHMFGFQPGTYIETSNVHFHLGYETSELPTVLSTVDIGIIPSLFRETYCLLLSEMWTARMPVIASNVGALSDRVIEDVVGKKVPAGDPEAIANAILWFVNNKSWYNWKFPVPRSAEEMTEDYLKLYRAL